jgi:hypothetical protein
VGVELSDTPLFEFLLLDFVTSMTLSSFFAASGLVILQQNSNYDYKI